MEKDEIVKSIFCYFESKGFQRLERVNLVTDRIPWVRKNFLPSLFIGQVWEIYKKELEDRVKNKNMNLKYYSKQDCIRYLDIDKVGDGLHSLWFNMIGAISYRNFSFAQMFGFFLDIPVHVLKISPQQIKLVASFSQDDQKAIELTKLLKKIIYSTDSLIQLECVYSEKGETGLTNAYPIGGPMVEIFFLTENSEMEFGSFGVLDKYIDNNGFVRLLDSPVIEFGYGLERILMVVNGLSSIYESSFFLHLDDILLVKYKEKESIVFQIADLCRGIIFMLNEGVLPSSRGRGAIIRRSFRKLFSLSECVGMVKSEILTVSEVVLRYYSGEFGLKRHLAKVFSEVLDKEFSLFKFWKKEVQN